MNYSEIIRVAISNKELSLTEICKLIRKHGYKTNKTYLSKLQNGKTPPASDSFNQIIAEVLGIDPIELKTAAYREKIPQEVLEKLQSQSKVNSA
ncbi:helix-turn-helix domain-containing protein [Brevibacillus laterosporus]|uniref:Helix-turn-helix domain-containing protein n=1 Tax=Brevibacillus laterosporus TaxID=1465 RepID=A0AAP3G9M7_BRELA|nr:helix-turn-helix domain-containing protein [Brevibacillus laterosporus]MCR8981601.1 helix-turn-helix domain-containing protein [Brevibacillus laterosporus]MCZ0808756.1 helix-turn-helix domain-containing protein [Brevibacillus laterosporus]MCZ0827271.1 helix-turn-helix domain-containing protein [Brevibacillus laterosporus]MCZ0851027.1 helix-turn-helix domain-containing protein [Brevibacillus laterosporus]